MQTQQRWNTKTDERSWVSLLPNDQGKAKWRAIFYLYEGQGQRPKEIRRRSPHKSKAKSQEWAECCLQGFLAERENEADATKTTVSAVCERWLATQDRDSANKRRHVAWLTRVWGADVEIAELSHEQIVGTPAVLKRPFGPKAKARSRSRRSDRNGRRRRKGEGLGPGTVRAICQTGNCVLDFAAQMGWRAPARIPLPVVPLPDAEWFTITELASLVSVAEPTFRLAYLIGARAGLRRGEIVELRWQDVDLARGVIRVARAYKRNDDGKWVVGPTKGGRPRSIRIPADLVDVLKEVRGKRGELVVRTAAGERLAPPAFTEQVARDAQRAGIERPGLGAHTLRHSFCSHLALGGAPVTVIQAAAGHQSLRTTEKYMHLRESDVDQLVDHLPPLDLS